MTLRTVARDTESVRTISLIVRSCSKKARLISPILSTPIIPIRPSRPRMAKGKDADTNRQKGGRYWTRKDPLKGSLLQANLHAGAAEQLIARKDEPIQLLRFANRVPLLYQQSSCAITKAVIQTNWRTYGLHQPKGALPVAPMAILVHVASVWVPYTSESKEAIEPYPEILKEI